MCIIFPCFIRFHLHRKVLRSVLVVMGINPEIQPESG